MCKLKYGKKIKPNNLALYLKRIWEWEQFWLYCALYLSLL
ncbi:Hypothetical protein BN2458_PEG0193 [Helicobacter typhlonius]|uniref:Uncharacterized protein n=1 Tax=Helicobacter typhlonius TaxID=76936 RepID=A0A0S4PRZ0_9HELI|nr:Hypothetical protein BN2458_PEG0193 [Helicobacter typhlonius]